MNIWKYSLAAGVLLSGCAGHAGDPAAPAMPHQLTVRGEVRATSNVAAAYALQATRVPYELRRLSKIEIFVKNTTNNGSEIDMGELTHTGTGDADHVFGAVKLKGLAANINYTVRLEAYQIDPAQSATTPVRVDVNDNHESETSFTTILSGPSVTVGASEDLLDIDALKGGFTLVLKDQAFNGKASGAVTVTNGQLKPTGVAIGLEVN